MTYHLKSAINCIGSLIILLAVCAILPAQDELEKKPLDHSDYDRWNTISGSSISNDGKWIQYTVQNGKGDSTLKFREAATSKEFTVQHGSGARFSFDSQYAVYRVNPDPEQLKKLRKAKTKPEDMPKSRIELLELGTGKLTMIEGASSFQMPRENGDWLAVMLNQKADGKKKDDKAAVGEEYEVTEGGLKRPSKPTKKKAKATKPNSEKAKPETPKVVKQEKPAKPKTKRAGNVLILRDLKSGLERRFPNVTSYQFSKHGNILVFASSVESGPSVKADPNGDGVSVVELKSGNLVQVATGLGNYRNIAIDDKGAQVAFLTDRDDYAAEKSSFALYHWRAKQKEAKRVAFEGDKGIESGWWVASTAAPQFSENGRRLYFSTAPKPEAEAKDDGEPKAKLDLWHWQDPQLQPQQLLQVQRERNRSYRAVYDLRSRKIVQLATIDIPSVSVDPRFERDVIVANTGEKYRKIMSWDIPGFQDTYLINQKTGDRKLVREMQRTSASMSTAGDYLIMWDTETRGWFALPTDAPADTEPVEISKGIDFPLFNELHDTPSDPRAHGIAGWLDDDEAVLIYDRYDIWKLDPTGKNAPVCVTNGVGRENRQRLRIVRLDSERRTVPTGEPLVLSVFDENTKGSGYSQWTLSSAGEEQGGLEQLILLNESVGRMTKAKNSNNVIFSRSTFRMSPDIWFSTLELKKIKRISRVNPQQRDYRWGTAELTKWQSADGEELEGLLYKPDGFDPNKKYPLLVYFYERNSDNLHRYYAPAAGRSIINFSFYVSRGYVLFVPDIPYKVGYPGQSAADSVLPGVEHIVEQGYIDEARIGMQGHSWGGYQTAYLVTQTDMFACAESGAPVSNMTSAYGGIRWGTGMSRMFQYEKTQSRIGATLWEDREKYILNSPLFQADRINTPLLILHNDEDGAVPWYQGIELFVALRRLEKPCWLMNYNQQPHWVMKEENRRDFARRMQQFFDHYLMGDPMPVWMAKGIPAVDKGKEFGFEPAETEAQEKPAKKSDE